MNVASKIPGMARAAGRMVGTAGRKFGEAAQTARERMTSPEMREFAATTGEGAGAVMGAAGRGAMAAGRIAGKVAGAAAGAGMEYGAKGTRALGRSGMEYGAKGARALGRGGMNVASKIPGMMGAAGRLLMGTNNPMANQPNSQMNNQGGMNYMQEGFLNAPPQQRSLGQDENGNPITEQTPDPLRQTYSRLINQNMDRSRTRGGIGTGVMSNLLTGGLSGLARGAYNKRQRNIGRQNLQNLNQYGLNATPFLRSEYETMRDRTIIRSRMTTEAIRSAYVI
jgi:Sec-independent protein translocase protein TatA